MESVITEKSDSLYFLTKVNGCCETMKDMLVSNNKFGAMYRTTIIMELNKLF